MNKSLKFYVLYCTDDRTYLSYESFWDNDVLKARKYKTIIDAKAALIHFDETIKIMEVSLNVSGIILSQQ